jgi:transposase-like protein
MGVARRRFTLAFKSEAPHRVIDSGRSIAQVSAEMSMANSSLARWVRDEHGRQGSVQVCIPPAAREPQEWVTAWQSNRQPPRKSIVGHGALARIATALAGVAALLSTWNAIKFHGITVIDILLPLALVFVVIDNGLSRRTAERPRVFVSPLQMVAVGLTVLAYVGTKLHPTSPAYVAGRQNLVSPDSVYGTVTGHTSDLTQLLRILLCIVVVACVIKSLSTVQNRPLMFINVWVVSALINSLAAATDAAHITHLNAHLLGFQPSSGRQAGLTLGETDLSVAAAMAIPFALVWWRRGHRWLSFGALVVLGLGVYLAGARGGEVAAAIAIVLSLRWGSQRTVFAAFAVIMIPLAAFLVDPGPVGHYFSRVGTALRLTNSTTGAASDASRVNLASQAIRDFQHNPITGIGYQFISQGHSVPLEILASGGLVALIGFLLFYLATAQSWQRIRASIPHDSGNYLYLRAAAISTFTLIVASFVENQIVDPYLYFPAGFLLAAASSPIWLKGDRWDPTQHPDLAIGSPALTIYG